MANRSKHVIFLGAGASYTSGYPVADGLRREWLGSPIILRSRVEKAISDVTSDHSAFLALEAFDEWLKSVRQPLQLFREGGFGTIDEFCYHLRGTELTVVSDLKKVLRLVFGMHTPELRFATSDYYQLVQKLFKPDKLTELREDIVICSFNYDPYLEFLLRRALQRRRDALLGKKGGIDSNLLRAQALVTSGFSSGKSGVDAIAEDDGFCVLKLHGIAAWPDRSERNPWDKEFAEISFEQIFGYDPHHRLSMFSGPAARTEVPIVFPWEIIREDGALAAEGEFALKDEPLPINLNGVPFHTGARQPSDPKLHRIFETIWTRAREEVQNAHKISFVGLSMHDYLRRGFEFLFRNKKGSLELVVTDAHSRAVGGDSEHLIAALRRLGPAFRTWSLLEKIAPGLVINKGRGTVRVRENFEDFILHEL